MYIGIHCEKLDIKWPRDDVPIAATLQRRCRFARYKLLSEACDMHEISVLAVAHHLADQVETFLMRVSRQSNLGGLACMRTLSRCPIDANQLHPRVQLWRPALSVSKVCKLSVVVVVLNVELARRKQEQLRDVCLDANVDWIEDPSNRNIAFRRVETRQLASELAERAFDRNDVGALVERIGLQEDALQRYARQYVERLPRQHKAGRTLIDARQLMRLPTPVARRIVLALFERQGDAAPSSGNVRNVQTVIARFARRQARQQPMKLVDLPQYVIV
jgi:tRNA(Ile)-lysidine synthase